MAKGWRIEGMEIAAGVRSGTKREQKVIEKGTANYFRFR